MMTEPLPPEANAGETSSGPLSHPSRRTLLKAASAAGIVWASPALHSVTAHAAGTCVSVQFDDFLDPVATTDPATDEDLDPCASGTGSIPDCTPSGGVNSQCNCSYETGVAAASPGVLTPDVGGGFTYTAPTGCKIFGASARLYQPLGSSGCAQKYPCQVGSIDSDTVATFPAPGGSQFYIAFRFVLCCT